MRHPCTQGAGLALLSLSLLLFGGAPPAGAHDTGPEAPVVSPDGSRLYVNNSRLTAVQVIDTATNQSVASVSLGSKNINLPFIALSPDGKRLYVPTLGTRLFSPGLADQLLVIDTAEGQVIAAVGVESFPSGVAVSPDGKRVYVANERSDTVSVVDTATLQVIASIPVGHGPAGVAASHDGRWVYVSNRFGR